MYPEPYRFSSVDLDRNPISYYVEWGDNTNTGWSMDYASGEEIKFSHTWNKVDTFTIKAKAKDTFG